MKLDMHFHSTLSDGRKTTVEIMELLKNEKPDFVACTDHDIINTEFPELAKMSGLKEWNTCEAVEVSGIDEKYNQHLHLTCYSKKFSRNVHDILKDSRDGRQRKMILQVELLKKNGFDIDWDSFLDFFENKGVNVDNFNSSHLSSYIFLKEEHIELIKNLTGELLNRDSFIKHCLKDSGKYPFVGAVTIPEYEPSLEKCGEMAKENRAILSLAHPNFKLTKEEFRQRLPYYMESGINAIEINSKATKEWVKLILELKNKHDYILTFGSDCHMRANDDLEHGEFLKMNPYVSEIEVDMNVYMIKKRIGLLDGLKISYESKKIFEMIF